MIVEVPDEPGENCNVEGLDEIVKSGATGCVTITLWAVEAVAPTESRTVSCTVKGPLVE